MGHNIDGKRRMNNIQVYICSHSIDDIKKLRNDDLYTPLLVGVNGKDNHGFCSDDSGDNISHLNQYYSELTGLYWMCKNSPYEIIGLDHYRCYFAVNKFGRILNKNDIESYLKNHDLIVPKRIKKINGSIYEVFGQDNLLKELMDESKNVIIKFYPEYLSSWHYIMENSEGSFLNMFIGSKKLMNSYCDWVFNIENNLLDTIDVSSNKRIMGVLSEILFNVWIHHNKLNVKECPIKYRGIKLTLFKLLSDSRFVRKFVKTFTKWKI